MGNKKKFYPDYLFEVFIAFFLIIELIFFLAMLFPQEPGREINFTTPFQPTPEWYFLWLYKLISYFPGNTAFIGAVLLPLACIVILITIPFFHKGKYGRAKASFALLFIYLMFIVFTILPLIAGDN